jgi:hypothetical protein
LPLRIKFPKSRTRGRKRRRELDAARISRVVFFTLVGAMAIVVGFVFSVT